jgi:rhomboid protease GluP
VNQGTPPRSEYPRPGIENASPQPAAPMPRLLIPRVRPYVSYVIMGLTILVFLLQMASQYMYNGNDWVAELGMKVNQLIIQGQYWRLITPVLLHGSILHLLFNMYALYAFGPGLESFYGHTRFLALYLVGGFAGNVASFIFSGSPSLGSSTAIFGLLGAEGVFMYQNRQIFGSRAQAALRNIIMVGLINLLLGLSPGIDNWGHIGGLLGGITFAWFASPRLGVEVSPEGPRVVDRRQSREVILTAVGVVAFVAFLAALTVFMRGG